MVESSVGGALVPSVMSEGKSSGIVASETQPGMSEGVAGGGEVAIASAGIGEGGSGAVELDKEFLCPICMQVIKDAFLTSCGHSFCYMCIVTHLRNKSDCPCCGHYLTINQLYPNFLLDKLLKKTSARQIPKNASPVEHLRSSIQQFGFFLKSEFIISQCHLILYIFFVFLDMIAYYCLFFTIYFLLSHLYFSSCKATLTLNMAMQLSKVHYLYLLKTLASLLIDSKVSYMPCYLILRQGCEISLKDIDGLLSLLLDKKRKMEQEEAETNMQILLDFLQCLRKQKLDELNEVQNDLQYIKEDVNAVERHRIELYRAKERYSMKLQTHLNDPMLAKLSPSVDKHNGAFFSSVRTVSGATCSGNFQKKTEIKGQASSQGYQRKDGFSGADPQNAVSLSGLSMARKKRVHVHIPFHI